MTEQTPGSERCEHLVRRMESAPTDDDRTVAVLAGECLEWLSTDEFGRRWVSHTLPCPTDTGGPAWKSK